VLLARDPILRRQVAIKILRDDLALSPEARHELTERMRQQACAAATLAHPVMVALHDMGDDERVGLYLVFELVRGPSLRERLHDGPLPAEDVARLALALGPALAYAHAAGLVHGGVKPENIMLTATGPKLTDFGLCLRDARPPAYSAPEVLASSAFGPPSDEFALAASMYEALTGRRAFPGDDPTAVAATIESGKHASPRSVLPALRGFLQLDAIFGRALAKDPRRRFPSCDAFASALAGSLQGPRVTFLATPGPLRTSITRATRRWQNGVALVAVAVIVALALVGRLRQPGGGTSAPPKSVASAPDKPAAPMHRVVPPREATGSTRPAPSSAPSPPAGSSELPAAPTFPSGVRLAPRDVGSADN